MAAKRRKIHCFCGEIRFTVTSSFGGVGGGEEEVKGAGGRDEGSGWQEGTEKGKERIEEARVKKEEGNGGRKGREGRDGK